MGKLVNSARATVSNKKEAVPTVQVTVVTNMSLALVMAMDTKLDLVMALDLAMAMENTLLIMVMIRKLLNFYIYVPFNQVPGGICNQPVFLGEL